MQSKEIIAKALKGLRRKGGLSSKEVAEELSARGVSVSPKTIYGWESGHSQPDAFTLLVLCDIYNVTDILLAFGYCDSDKAQRESKTPEKTKLLMQIEQLNEYRCDIVSAYIDGLLTDQGKRSRALDM